VFKLGKNFVGAGDRYLRSCTFGTADKSQWLLELRPCSHSNFTAKLIIHAVPTPHELKNGQMHRKLIIKCLSHTQSGEKYRSGGSNEAFFTADFSKHDTSTTHFSKVIQNFSYEKAETLLFTDMYVLELELTPRFYSLND